MTFFNAVSYDQVTGRIICVTHLREGVPALNAMLHPSPEPNIGATHYVVFEAGKPRVVDRPVNPAYLVGRIIRGIPKGAKLVIGGVSYAVDDGVADLEFDCPGTYTVSVLAFPYRDAEFQVTV